MPLGLTKAPSTSSDSTSESDTDSSSSSEESTTTSDSSSDSSSDTTSSSESVTISPQNHSTVMSDVGHTALTHILHDEQEIFVPPGQGKKTTHARNLRRRKRNLFKKLGLVEDAQAPSSVGTNTEDVRRAEIMQALPAHAVVEETQQYMSPPSQRPAHMIPPNMKISSVDVEATNWVPGQVARSSEGWGNRAKKASTEASNRTQQDSDSPELVWKNYIAQEQESHQPAPSWLEGDLPIVGRKIRYKVLQPYSQNGCLS